MAKYIDDKIEDLRMTSENLGKLGKVTNQVESLLSFFDSKFSGEKEDVELMLQTNSNLKDLYEKLIELSERYKNKLDEINNLAQNYSIYGNPEEIIEVIELHDKFGVGLINNSQLYSNLSQKQKDFFRDINNGVVDVNQIKIAIDDEKNLNQDLIKIRQNVNTEYKNTQPIIEKNKETLTKILGISKLIWGEIKEGGNKWIEIDDKVTKVGRSIGLSTSQIRGYQQNILSNYGKMAQQLGMTFEELFQFQEKLAKSTGRAISLSNDQTKALASVSKLVGETATEEMVKNMDDFGASTQVATSYLTLNMARARSQGLDAQKASESFAKNVKLAAQYNFREGVNGISKMTLLSQKLKFNMDSIANAADKFNTVESAIGTAANLQMLGGSYSAQFGNPLEAMNMAMLDMEGFTNKIVDTFSGKAIFNRESGQVEMSAIDKRLMQEAAKQLGISFEEAWNIASQKARVGDVERQLGVNTNNFTEDERSWITSKAQYNATTKQHYVTIYENGEEKNIDVSKLNKKQLEIAREQSDLDKVLYHDVHDIHDKLTTYIVSQAKDNKTLREAIKGNEERWQIGKADTFDDVMNSGKSFLSSDNWWWTQIATSIGASVTTLLAGDLLRRKGTSFGTKAIGKGKNAISGLGGKLWKGTKSVGKSVANVASKTGKYLSKAPGWLKIVGLATAAIGGGMSLMSAADGSKVDKSKLGGREVIPNENDIPTSSVTESQELIELQKQTVLLKAIASKQGVNVSKVYENSTINKTDVENNSEQTTASSVLSDTMNTTLIASQLGKTKVAESGFKAIAGKSGLKLATNMGRMAKASNPLGWISLGSSVLKEVSGVEEGSSVDKAWSTANSALDGAALGAMVGSLIPGIGTAVGGAVGGVIGGAVGIIDNYGKDIKEFGSKLYNGVKDGLFGKDNMTVSDKFQQKYEESKLGIVDINDPQLEQKAYYATCKIHDIVVSMWHHMNGKQSNGLKEDKGLFGNLFSNLFSSKNEQNEITNNSNNNEQNEIINNSNNASYDYFLNKKDVITNDLNITKKIKDVTNKHLLSSNYQYDYDYINSSYRKNSLIDTNILPKDIHYNNDIIPKVTVGLPTSIKDTSIRNYYETSLSNIGNGKIDLNVNGTIKLTSDKGNYVDLDLDKLIHNEDFIKGLVDAINSRLSKDFNGGRVNKNKNKIYNTANGTL